MRSMASVRFEKLPNVPDCCTIAVEHGNLDSGPFIVLNKFTPGCSIPWHWHSQNEKVMMISGSGTFRIRGEKSVTMRSGDFGFAPPHHTMSFTCGPSAPCLLFVEFDGTLDVHYVDEAGNEIPAEQALKPVKASGGAHGKK